jgi:hypothetical protein
MARQASSDGSKVVPSCEDAPPSPTLVAINGEQQELVLLAHEVCPSPQFLVSMHYEIYQYFSLFAYLANLCIAGKAQGRGSLQATGLVAAHALKSHCRPARCCFGAGRLILLPFAQELALQLSTIKDRLDLSKVPQRDVACITGASTNLARGLWQSCSLSPDGTLCTRRNDGSQPGQVDCAVPPPP